MSVDDQLVEIERILSSLQISSNDSASSGTESQPTSAHCPESGPGGTDQSVDDGQSPDTTTGGRRSRGLHEAVEELKTVCSRPLHLSSSVIQLRTQVGNLVDSIQAKMDSDVSDTSRASMRSDLETLQQTLQAIPEGVASTETGRVTMNVGGASAVNLFPGSEMHGDIHIHAGQQQGTGQAQGDPVFRNLLDLSKAFFLGHHCTAFVPTAPFMTAETVLRSHGQVVLTGGPGDGKTTAAVHLIQKMFDLSKCIRVTSPENFNNIDLSRVDCLFFDDFCGTVTLDHKQASEYKNNVLSSLNYKIQGRQITVVFSCRTPIMSKLCSKGVFRDTHVVHFASSGLSSEDKGQLLKCHLQNSGRNLSDENISACLGAFQSPIGFPQCCFLFTEDKRLFEKGVSFFQQPYAFLCENIELMADESKFQYCFLALLLFCEGGLQQKQLDDLSSSETCLTMLKRLGVTANEMASSYRETFEALKYVYVKYDEIEEVYSFSHDTIKEAVCLSVGRRYPSLVLGMCSWSIISNYVHTKRPAAGDREDVLIVPKSCHGQLAERFVKALQEEHFYLYQLVRHRALFDSNFMDSFLSFLEEQNKPEIVLGCGGSTERGTISRHGPLSWMFYCGLKDYENMPFLKKIVKCRYFSRSHADLFRFNLGKLLMLACETGNPMLFKLMMENAAPIWPYCLSAAVKHCNSDIARRVTEGLLKQSGVQFVFEEILDAVLVSVDHCNFVLFDFLFQTIASQQSFDIGSFKTAVYRKKDLPTYSTQIINSVESLSTKSRETILDEIYLVCVCSMGHIEGYKKMLNKGHQLCPGCLTVAVENCHYTIAEDILHRFDAKQELEWVAKEKKNALLRLCLGPDVNGSMYQLLISRFQEIPEGCLRVAVGSHLLSLVEDILLRMSSSTSSCIQEEKDSALQELLTEESNITEKVRGHYGSNLVDLYKCLVSNGARLTKGCLLLATKCSVPTLVEEVLVSMAGMRNVPWVQSEIQEAFEAFVSGGDSESMPSSRDMVQVQVFAPHQYGTIIDRLMDVGAKVTTEYLHKVYQRKLSMDVVENILVRIEEDKNSALSEACKYGTVAHCEILIGKGAKVTQGCLTRAVCNKTDLEVVNFVLHQLSLKEKGTEWVKREISFCLDLALSLHQYYAALKLLYAGAIRQVPTDEEVNETYCAMVGKPVLHSTATADSDESDSDSNITITNSIITSFIALRAEPIDLDLNPTYRLTLATELTTTEITFGALNAACTAGNFKLYKELMQISEDCLWEELMLAATKGNCLEIVSDLVDQLTFSTAVDKARCQRALDVCLKYACEKGDVQIFEKLVSRGATLTKGCLISVFLKQELWEQSHNLLIQAVQIELAKMGNPDWVSKEINSCLIFSVERNDLRLFNYLLNNGADISPDCITEAVSVGNNCDMLKLILARLSTLSEQPEWVQNSMDEALHIAVRKRRLDYYSLLLEPANCYCKDSLAFLISEGAGVDSFVLRKTLQMLPTMPDQARVQKEKNAALTVACRVGSMSHFRLMKEIGGEVTTDCLWVAIRCGSEDIFQEGLDEIAATDEDVLEPLLKKLQEEACRFGRIRVYRLLKAKGGSFHASFLQTATRCRRVGMMEELLKYLSTLPEDVHLSHKEDIIAADVALKTMGMNWMTHFLRETFPRLF